MLHGIFAPRPEASTACRATRCAEVERYAPALERRSRSSRPRRCGRSCAPPAPSRTPRIYLTAAFTGLRRGELRRAALARRRLRRSAIRVRGSYAGGALTTPKSGQGALGADGAGGGGGARAARPARATGPATTTSCSSATPAGTSTPRRCGAATGRRSSGRPAPAALPRPAPHVRHADDRPGRHPPRAGVDGPRRRPDDDAVPALRAAARRRRAWSPRRSAASAQPGRPENESLVRDVCAGRAGGRSPKDLRRASSCS